MLKEFKEFATRGNVIDLAVAIVLGTAFVKIVDSLVNDILMPPLGMLLANVDFSDLFVTLKGAKHATLAQAQEAGAVTMNYGLFINQVITFLIVAFAVFLIVKQVNRMTKKEAASPTTKECSLCFTTIPIQAVRCPNCTGNPGAAVMA